MLTVRQSEICNLGDVANPVVHQDDVGKFHVAHDDAVRVAVPQTLTDVAHAAGRTTGGGEGWGRASKQDQPTQSVKETWIDRKIETREREVRAFAVNGTGAHGRSRMHSWRVKKNWLGARGWGA